MLNQLDFVTQSLLHLNLKAYKTSIPKRKNERYPQNTMTIIYEKRCPHCQGDILFAVRLEGPTLKCLQCTRLIDRQQAREMLTRRIEQPAA